MSNPEQQSAENSKLNKPMYKHLLALTCAPLGVYVLKQSGARCIATLGQQKARCIYTCRFTKRVKKRGTVSYFKYFHAFCIVTVRNTVAHLSRKCQSCSEMTGRRKSGNMIKLYLSKLIE